MIDPMINSVFVDVFLTDNTVRKMENRNIGRMLNNRNAIGVKIMSTTCKAVRTKIKMPLADFTNAAVSETVSEEPYIEVKSKARPSMRQRWGEPWNSSRSELK